MRRMAVAAGLAAFWANTASAQAAPPPPDVIRVSFDGAGPSHIFWIGTRDGGTRDLIGIVDPLFSAIRLYDVDRAGGGNDDLSARLHPLGVCGLPVGFRPWRIHQLAGAVVIESMPEVGKAAEMANLQTLRTRTYRIVRAELLGSDATARKTAFDRLETTKWDPATAPPCGTLGSEGLVGGKLGLTARRLSNRAIRIGSSSTGEAALAPPATITVNTTRVNANMLYSARELEPTATRRVVLASEGMGSADGMVRIRQRLLVYDRTKRTLVGEMTFDDTFLRSKIGFRPIAVLPSGEVLAMGKAYVGDKPPFRLMSCGSVLGSPSTTPKLCGPKNGDVTFRTGDAAATGADPQAVTDDDGGDSSAFARGTLSASQIFANASPLFNYPLVVDTSRIPEECRLADGCFTGQRKKNGDALNFVPIRGMRLTRGVFRRTGLPYAQASVPEDMDALLKLPAGSTAPADALANAVTGVHGQPGNLMDNFSGDRGVDCSGLVQVAWGGRNRPHKYKGDEDLNRLSTASLQNFRDDLVCKARLGGIEQLRPGDAISLNVTNVTNHVMLFAAQLKLDGGNDAWLMLESSSSCDGVCWTVYDPSFFNGWGMYRAAGRSDRKCPGKDGVRDVAIPDDYDAWTAKVAKPVLPARRR